MPTPKLIWYEGAIYHITTRGNHRNDIFRDEEEFKIYLNILEEALIYYSHLQYELVAYCDDGDGVPTVTDAEANALMDLVIAKNIFASASGSLIGKKDAKVVTTNTSNVEVA